MDSSPTVGRFLEPRKKTTPETAAELTVSPKWRNDQHDGTKGHPDCWRGGCFKRKIYGWSVEVETFIENYIGNLYTVQRKDPSKKDPRVLGPGDFRECISECGHFPLNDAWYQKSRQNMLWQKTQDDNFLKEAYIGETIAATWWEEKSIIRFHFIHFIRFIWIGVSLTKNIWDGVVISLASISISIQLSGLSVITVRVCFQVLPTKTFDFGWEFRTATLFQRFHAAWFTVRIQFVSVQRI